MSAPLDYRCELDWYRPEFPEGKTVWYCPGCEEPREDDEILIDDCCAYCGTEVEERDE